MIYTVICEEILSVLILKVNERLQDGWELVGGVAISISESDEYNYPYFAQAMVKK